MDVTLILFYLAVSSLFTVLGFIFKQEYLAGLGALGFILTGFAFITAGVDVQSLYTQQTNYSAFDGYNVGWNTTYNQSFINNVTSSINRTQTQTFTYLNQTDNNTRFFAVLIIFGGLLIALTAFTEYKKIRAKPDEE